MSITQNKAVHIYPILGLLKQIITTIVIWHFVPLIGIDVKDGGSWEVESLILDNSYEK